MRILIVEAERLLAGAISRTLARRGHEALVAADAERGLQEALGRRHDLVVLDLRTVRGGGGPWHRVREQARVLTIGGDAPSDLAIGAVPAAGCEHLVWPFAMETLVERVEGLGRRPMAPVAAEVRAGDLVLDSARRRVSRRGVDLGVTRMEFAVLEILIREPGRTFSQAELSARIWHSEHRYGSRTVEMLMSRLRRKLADDRSSVLRSVYGVGYGLEPAAGEAGGGNG